MALKLETIGGFGTGALGDVAEDIYAANLNSYAHVTAIGSNSITIDGATAIHGSYEDFSAGTEILFHVSTSNDSNTADYLGRFLVAKITSVTDNVLVVDQTITDLIPNDEFPKYNCQVVTVAQFKNLTLNEGIKIQPIAYSDTTFVGGIVALKCSEALNFAGGHIDVADRGIPNTDAGKNLRPLNEQETKGYKDTDTYSGWENSQAKFCLPLNVGDGLVFLAAKKLSCNEKSRIGNALTTGQQFMRGSSSYYINTRGACHGGACIYIAANEIANFVPDIIAKYDPGNFTNKGKGLGRCYIASNTILRNDEGLYAFEILSEPLRPMKIMNIKDFGSGALGTANNIAVQINNYAKVVKISDDRKILTYTGKTSTGMAPITRGALVMVHFCHKGSAEGVVGIEKTGQFILAKVLADNGTDLTLDTAIPEVNLEENFVQIISVAQYTNFTLSVENSATPQWVDGIGGIFAIAVKNNCNLSGGKINVYAKGTFNLSSNTIENRVYYGREGLAHIGNNQDCDKLPLGQGNGSVFILAKELTMDENTRIGGTWSGNNFGGIADQGCYDRNQRNPKKIVNEQGTGGGYAGMYDPNTKLTLTDMSGNSIGEIFDYWGGSGEDGGKKRYQGSTDKTVSARTSYGDGGYGSNGGKVKETTNNYGCKQGAHIMIIAYTIKNFNIAAISTGGAGGFYEHGNGDTAGLIVYLDQCSGGAGYGGAGASTRSSARPTSGGYNGGGLGGYYSSNSSGGGSSGWAFIYCNNVVNQSTDGIII